MSYREDAFDALTAAAIKGGFELPVAGGKCHGKRPRNAKIVGPKPPPRTSNPDTKARDWSYTIATYRSYKFALVMENSVHDYYITEKIVCAFVAGAIPVYYGTTNIFKLFNKEAFIFYDIKNPQEAVQRIMFLNSHPQEYDAMMKKPILAEGALEKYFSLNGDLGRRIREMLSTN